MNYNQIKKKVKKFNPDIVGITVFVTPAINICYNIAKIVKEISQNIIVVFGGRHFTSNYDAALKVDEVDIIVRGEGEITFRELILKGTPENIKGISYKSNGKIIHNPDRELIKDFENIRYPARHLTKNNKYKMLTVRIETVETSRGCPYRCKFCTTPSFSKGVWRSRPIEKIITELKMISHNRKITDILFVDDNFAADTKRIKKLCERIIECKKTKEINDLKFFAQIRVDSVVSSPQMIKKMAEAGFWVVLIGIESVNEETLKDMRKEFTFDKVLKALKILHENNIIIIGNLIIGYNLDATEEEIKSEIEFIKKFNIDIVDFKILTPFPGSYENFLKSFSCPKCIQRKNQKITHGYCEYIFGQQFEVEKSLKKIFDPNKNPEIKGLHSSVHLDIFQKLDLKDKNGNFIKLGVRYNGKQHDDSPEGWDAFKRVSKHPDVSLNSRKYKELWSAWRKLIKTDKIKVDVFEKNKDKGYYLIEVDYRILPSQRQQFIISKFEELTGIKIDEKDSFDWRRLL